MKIRIVPFFFITHKLTVYIRTWMYSYNKMNSLQNSYVEIFYFWTITLISLFINTYYTPKQLIQRKEEIRLMPRNPKKNLQSRRLRQKSRQRKEEMAKIMVKFITHSEQAIEWSIKRSPNNSNCFRTTRSSALLLELPEIVTVSLTLRPHLHHQDNIRL